MLIERFKVSCREWYLGGSDRSLRFRLSLLVFDLVTIAFFVISSMVDPHWIIFAIDYVIAFLIALDLYARSTLVEDKRKWWRSFDTALDIIIILSLLASVVTNNLSFLRIIRTLRLLRSYHVLRDLKEQYPWFKAHQDTIESSFNLFVFVFFISACVFVLENNINDQINNYLDALYFTVTTLTTTGFGDITLKDSWGRMLSIVIMVVGVSLFLRLVQTIFRPQRVRFPCPDCGLHFHDEDAVHCKHCGRVLNIPSDGF